MKFISRLEHMDNQRWFITMLIWDIREFKILSKLCYADQMRELRLVAYYHVMMMMMMMMFVIPLITLLRTPDYFIISHPVLQMLTTPHLHDNNMTRWYLNFIIMVFKLWPLWSLTTVSLVRKQTKNKMKVDANPI